MEDLSLDLAVVFIVERQCSSGRGVLDLATIELDHMLRGHRFGPDHDLRLFLLERTGVEREQSDDQKVNVHTPMLQIKRHLVIHSRQLDRLFATSPLN